MTVSASLKLCRVLSKPAVVISANQICSRTGSEPSELLRLVLISVTYTVAAVKMSSIPRDVSSRDNRPAASGNFVASNNDDNSQNTPTVSPSPMGQVADSSGTGTLGFTASEVEVLSRALARLRNNSFASTSLARSGTASAFSATGSIDSTSWVIDSGATDHMTHMSSLFSSYHLLSGQDKMRVADGSFSTISGKGIVDLSKDLSLKSVLHVPSLTSNLLSVSKLTKNLNCSINFFPTHCVFQDRLTKRTIGSGHECGGLYYFGADISSALQSSATSSQN